MRPPSTVRIPHAAIITVTILAALALAAVLAQVLTLGREAGIDKNALGREQIGVTVTAHIVTAIDTIIDYRYAIMFKPSRIPATRPRAAAAMERLGADFTTGQASVLGLQSAWKSMEADWQRAQMSKGVDALAGFKDVTNDGEGLISSVQDASGISYDPAPITSYLSDTYMQETVLTMMGMRKLQVMSDLAFVKGGMSLDDRVEAGGFIFATQGGLDLSRDVLGQDAAELSRYAPEQAAQWNQMPVLSARMNHDGNAYLDMLTKSVMLKPKPAVSMAEIDAAADSIVGTARALNVISGQAMLAELAERGRIQAERNRFMYLAYVLSGILLFSVMMIIAMLVARRDRALLREALRESARLQAELARQEAEEALRLTEAQFRAVFDGAAVGIAVIDRTRSLVDANDVFRTMFGDSVEVALAEHQTEVDALWNGERDTFEFEQQFRSPSGQEIWADATVSIVMDEQRHPRFAICMFRDKTALKHTERRIAHDKTHDSLTGLPNRALFEDRLRGRFAEASALLDSFFAVLFVDLERFKEINESLGHAAGDLVLTQIAGRLRSSVDARDVVARVGGDEFAVLVQSLGDILHVESVARRILNNLSKAITIGQRSVFLGSSVGIALWSSRYERAEDVMRDAEIAMQHAKSTGGARYAVFDSTMHDRAQKRLALISDLRLGIDRQEFRMVYQPIVSIVDGRPFGCEALIRWDHPTQGTLGPTAFIPLAEQTGLAHTIGRFVLQSACQQLGAWRRNRGGNLDFSMHVNISATELSDPDFERTLVQIVEHHGLSPSDFTLEITESVVLDEGTRANRSIERVRDRGFKICIDDFGTGYSSLRYLQQFEVDSIKIDRSFVAGENGELASEPIVRTLITLAEAYNVRIVAEGVETTSQRDMLRAAGCRLAQGFLFAVPLTPAEMAERYPDVLGRVSRPASA